MVKRLLAIDLKLAADAADALAIAICHAHQRKARALAASY
jgi:crossover junction endodeoxyribonuclease RuvC